MLAGTRGFLSFGSSGLSGLIAGPFRTFPSGSNREPWQGQSQLLSVAFQATIQPRWGQTAERSCSLPCLSRCTAILDNPRRRIAPPPAWISSGLLTSPDVTQLAYCEATFKFSLANVSAASGLFRA